MSKSRAIIGALVAMAGLTLPVAASQAQTAPVIYAGLDRGVHALVVKITVKPDRAAEFLQLMRARIEQSRGDPAVVDFRVFGSADPAVFYAFESFHSREAFNAFAKSPDSAAFAIRIKEVVAQPLKAQVLKLLS